MVPRLPDPRGPSNLLISHPNCSSVCLPLYPHLYPLANTRSRHGTDNFLLWRQPMACRTNTSTVQHTCDWFRKLDFVILPSRLGYNNYIYDEIRNQCYQVCQRKWELCRCRALHRDVVLRVTIAAIGKGEGRRVHACFRPLKAFSILCANSGVLQYRRAVGPSSS